MLYRSKNEADRLRELNPYFLSWICEGGDERYRPFGRMMTHGCGVTNSRRAKKWQYHLQGKCKHCSRKRRLNEGNVLFHRTWIELREYCVNENWNIGFRREEE
jgi:hypothetical protein